MDRWSTLGMFPTPGLPILTLKQFRDAEKAEDACYQALVHSIMQLDRIHGVGPQGPMAMTMGDLSGGYRVKLHEHPSQPIVSQLGIQVTRRDRAADGTQVATVTPMSPYWIAFDFTHGPETEIVGWRSGSSGWHTRESAAPTPAPGRAHPDGARYNPSREQADTCQRGPFRIDGGQLHLVPVPARKEALQEACARYLAGPDGLRLELMDPDHPVVVLTVLTGRQHSLPSSRSWPIRWLSCLVPVLLDGEPALLAPYEFGGDPISTVTARELEGRAMVLADVGGSWAGDRGAADHLGVKTTAFRYLAADVKADQELVLRVQATGSNGGRADAAADAADPASRLARTWLPRITDGKRAQVRLLGLKQYRDAARPDLAAYQAIVEHTVTLGAAGDGKAHDLGPQKLTFGDAASCPLVRTLGLEVARAGHAHTFPVSLELSMGRRLFTRGPDGLWHRQ
jgi:hypothetical protein